MVSNNFTETVHSDIIQPHKPELEHLRTQHVITQLDNVKYDYLFLQNVTTQQDNVKYKYLLQPRSTQLHNPITQSRTTQLHIA